MNDQQFIKHLKRAVDCPGMELSSNNSPCARLIIREWTNLLGWGNPQAKIVFVGINPLLTDKALTWHTPPKGVSPLKHAQILTKIGAANVKHFSYHRRILRELREKDSQLAKELPNTDELSKFAFFTEVAFCPSKKQSDLTKEIMKRCFRRNAFPFLMEPNFEVIIALGRMPSEICIDTFVSAEKAKNLKIYHGQSYRSFTGKHLITSYAPNAHGKWDKSAVANLLYQLHKDRLLNLI
jgi:hypothetical protein